MFKFPKKILGLVAISSLVFTQYAQSGSIIKVDSSQLPRNLVRFNQVMRKALQEKYRDQFVESIYPAHFSLVLLGDSDKGDDLLSKEEKRPLPVEESVSLLDFGIRSVISRFEPIDMSSLLPSGKLMYWKGALPEGTEMRAKFGISPVGPYSPVVLKFEDVERFEILADQLKSEIDQKLVRTQLSGGKLTARKDFPFSLHATCGYLNGIPATMSLEELLADGTLSAKLTAELKEIYSDIKADPDSFTIHEVMLNIPEHTPSEFRYRLGQSPT